MKRIFCLIITLVSLTAYAQPSAVQRTGKSVFTLTTYKADGGEIAKVHGIFIDAEGTAISPWTPFVGSARAVVTTAEGKRMEVDCLLGANELYNVAKFQVSGTTSGTAPARSASSSGTNVWLVTAEGKAAFRQTKVTGAEKFNQKYNYYLIDADGSDALQGCPVVNSNGQVIGLAEKSVATGKTQVTDALFAQDLSLGALSINDAALSQSAIRVGLPKAEKDAQITLMLARDKYPVATVRKIAQEYIRKFPKSIEGYQTLAETEIRESRWPAADEILQSAVKSVGAKDEAHAAYAKLIYQKNVQTVNSGGEDPYPAWSLDKAMQEAQLAYTANPSPVYQHQQAQITFLKGDYDTAYQQFIGLTGSDLHKGELYYEAAQCRANTGGSAEEILNLLNQAVEACPQPLDRVSANILLARGMALDGQGEYRKALQDYNKYDTLMYGMAHDSFYYTRFKCESRLHQYKQALGDIAHAILINPDEPTYYAEMAALQLRVKQLPEAISIARRCTEIAPEYADAYLLLGIAQIENKQKQEGLRNLEKAKILGDPRADVYLKKYK